MRVDVNINPPPSLEFCPEKSSVKQFKSEKGENLFFLNVFLSFKDKS